MYDMTRVMSKGYNDSVTRRQRTQTLAQLSQQRWVDAEKYAGLSTALQRAQGWGAQFWWTPRLLHDAARSIARAVNSNAWTMTTPYRYHSDVHPEISPRPILFVHGELAHSRYFSETAHACRPAERADDHSGRHAH